MKTVKHANNYIHPDNVKAIAFFKTKGITLTPGDKTIVDYDYWSGCPIIKTRKVLYVNLNIGSKKFHKLLVDNGLLCGKSTLHCVDDSSVRNFNGVCDLLGI